MKLRIELDSHNELARYIKQMADHNGVSRADYVVHLLEKGVHAEKQSNTKSS